MSLIPLLYICIFFLLYICIFFAHLYVTNGKRKEGLHDSGQNMCVPAESIHGKMYAWGPGGESKQSERKGKGGARPRGRNRRE
jgi:hypothetical protein